MVLKKVHDPYKEMLTVSQVAEYLNLNEKMIYRLVNGGRLPGTKVTGKWTFPLPLVRQWMETNAYRDIKSYPSGPGLDSLSDLFIGGSNDLVMEHIVSKLLKRRSPESLVYFATTGSMNGLRALSLGKAHLAGVHLYSPEDDAYNTPFVRKYLPGKKTILFNLAYRQQGILLRMEDEGRIGGVRDFPGIRIVNREAGSGTRHLLDIVLAKEKINPRSIRGYGDEVSTHLEVGLTILRKEADAGLGIEPVARMLGLSFVPLSRERYDIVIPVDYIALPAVEAFIDVLQSGDLKSEVSNLPGYDFSEMGKIIH